MIWIGYTTKYRDGGEQFARVAATMAREFSGMGRDPVVRCEAVESKRAFAAAMARIRQEGRVIDELHFIGHSGMYGIMFGTTAWPEQFSPHEWSTLEIPFGANAKAWFHACRTARWFAPFFARTFGVTTYGYYWYTTVSRSSKRFRWDRFAGSHDPLYIVSCPGRKSHGLVGSLLKHVGLSSVEAMRGFAPTSPDVDASYDKVASLYDAAFGDVTVRKAEWRWLLQHLPAGDKLRVLDIGCGNGALLAHLGDRLSRGVGVDRSPVMTEIARMRNVLNDRLEFQTIDGPSIPLPDASMDVVISFMSFRYLDWDPMLKEMRRVLVPGGRILVVDMAASPLRLRDLPSFMKGRIAFMALQRRNPQFIGALRRLVHAPEWQAMLTYNPVRAEHEYRWYLESRHPSGQLEVLNVGYTEKLLAFDTGPLEPGTVPPLTYP